MHILMGCFVAAVRTGVLEVTGPGGAGYVSSKQFGGAVSELDTDLSNAMCFAIPDALNAISTPIFPLVSAANGQIFGVSASIASNKYSYDFYASMTPTGADDVNVGLLTQTSLTTVGAPPEEVPLYGNGSNKVATVFNGPYPFESAIWSIDAASVVTAQWVNPPGIDLSVNVSLGGSFVFGI